MLQRYIRALADLSVNVKTYQPSISGTVAKDELNNPVPSDCAKKCQQIPTSQMESSHQQWTVPMVEAKMIFLCEVYLLCTGLVNQFVG